MLNEINEIALKKLEVWILKKFLIRGNENTAKLFFLKIDTNLIEKSKNKKKIISIFQQSKETYDIALKFDLSITSNNGLIKTLKISSNFDFTVRNKLSITQRDKIILYNIS